MIKLDRLINVLGGLGARPSCVPRSRQTELRAITLYEPGEVDTEDVVLAVGVETPEAVRELLSTTEAAVVVFRLAELDETALAVARDRGVAVLLVERSVSWGQLAGVVFGLVLEGRETEEGRGPTDLFALADTLADSVGGPVTIENHHSGVLAYSGQRESADRARLDTILSRRVPEKINRELTARGVFAHLNTSDEPLFVEPLESVDFRGRVVVAVRAGRELLGSIWVEVSEPLPEQHQAALVEGARTAALHMLRMRASADLERQVESDLVIGLLEGTVDAQAVVSRLGLRAARFRVVAMQADTEGERAAATLLTFERTTTGFGWARTGRSALFANTVYTILPCGTDPAPAREWVHGLLPQLPADLTLFAGIGGVADSLHLAASRQEADESLAISSAGEAAVYDLVWHEIVLSRLRHAAAAGRIPSCGPVVDLRRHDDEHGTKYAETLRAWLECQSDQNAAAARLAVHPNTVRYRLRKMAEVTQLDLDDPDKRLAMTIGLAIE